MKPRSLTAAVFALGGSIVFGGSVLAIDYGGWQTTGAWRGIHGNLRQSQTVSTTGLHAVWLTICPNPCDEWVQTGTWQGNFAGGNSPSSVRIYLENVDPCGTYYVADLGTRPQPTIHFYLHNDGLGQHTYYCPGGPIINGYAFRYKMGSYSSTPYYTGVLSSVSGLAMAKTETQNRPPINNDFFGCDASMQCSDPASELRLWNGSLWRTWTPSIASSVSSHSDPPFLHTYHNYYAFKTCPSAC